MLNYKTFLHHPEAPWITFVHGAGGSSTIWFKQIKTFASHYNLLMVDLRGHGGSKHHKTQQSRRYNFAEIGDDIIEVLQHLQIEKSHFIGISLGTVIIRDLAERYPEKVIRLIMGGAVMKLNLRSRFLMNIARFSKSIVPYMFLYSFFAFIVMPKKNHKESRLLFINEAKKLYQKEFKKWVTLFTTLNPLVAFFRIKESAAKTLYVMGAEDYMFLPAIKKLTQHHTNAELFIIPDCGHVVNVEQPEIFNQKVFSFLERS
ncbi:2-succinyl-6-hydroxy-2,4-cyclohexadiene-1-carboxylate synthase [Taibaiella sp. KBW10]|uniref:alpha/beta fold hydrolase n=1 Tax=Taibaiella sp. KBW10 TaxID=2153357 RepID=UPI000F5947B9|nr:alpha/beta hydrolase [Taibaiella sp. KBW10]RQO32146.1 2-succinyl-6-hydroxy-2,4-cyclohexadiene-1-carboxylate synthase [Taibaiella sp. KBW10]